MVCSLLQDSSLQRHLFVQMVHLIDRLSYVRRNRKLALRV